MLKNAVFHYFSSFKALFGSLAWKPARSIAFEITRKRRKEFPSETGVKGGRQVVRGEKDLPEKLGRNGPCPCDRPAGFKNGCMQSGR